MKALPAGTFKKSDPRYGLKKNSGRHKVDGVLFESWRTGITQSKWVTEDGRIEVWSNHNFKGYGAAVDGVVILTTKPKTIRATRYREAHLSDREPPAKRFQTMDTACRAAIKKRG